MLPTNKDGALKQNRVDKRLVYKENVVWNNTGTLGHNPQHLYILSDEEIKEGDWIYHTLDDKPIKATDEWFINGIKNLKKDLERTREHGYKKVIATTDKSLEENIGWIRIKKEKREIFQPLPQPSQSFIKKFVTEYNKGNIIEEIMVEYNCLTSVKFGIMDLSSYDLIKNRGDSLCIEDKLKVSSDNTITIKKIKDSWSRDEVSAKIHEAVKAWNYERLDDGALDLDKWIKENL